MEDVDGPSTLSLDDGPQTEDSDHMARRPQQQQREVPDIWAELMVEKGYHYRGKPSASRLAEAAGVSTQTTLRLIHQQTVDADTVSMIGKALGEPDWVAYWAGLPAPRSFEPPVEADYLDDDERKAVDRIIRLLARNKTGVDGHGAPAEKMSPVVGGGTETSGPMTTSPEGDKKPGSRKAGTKAPTVSAQTVRRPDYDPDNKSDSGSRGSHTRGTGNHGKGTEAS